MFIVLVIKRSDIKKIYRIVSFKEKPFLKEYILSLTKLRSIAAAKNLTFFVNVFKILVY